VESLFSRYARYSGFDDIVETDEFDIRVFNTGPENQATNTTKTIDANFECHKTFSEEFNPACIRREEFTADDARAIRGNARMKSENKGWGGGSQDRGKDETIESWQ